MVNISDMIDHDVMAHNFAQDRPYHEQFTACSPFNAASISHNKDIIVMS